MAVKEKQTVNVPVWAGFGAIMVACPHPPFMLGAPCGARQFVFAVDPRGARGRHAEEPVCGPRLVRCLRSVPESPL